MTNNDKNNLDEQASGDGQPNPAVAADVVEESEINAERILERTILFALDEAGEQLKQSGGVEPFTVLIKGEELFVEEQPGISEEISYAAARRAVFQMENLCNAYVFCYDGYVDLDSGQSDALIAEFANKEDEQAQVIVRLYNNTDDGPEIEDTLYHVGDAETLFGSKREDWEGILTDSGLTEEDGPLDGELEADQGDGRSDDK